MYTYIVETEIYIMKLETYIIETEIYIIETNIYYWNWNIYYETLNIYYETVNIYYWKVTSTCGPKHAYLIFTSEIDMKSTWNQHHSRQNIPTYIRVDQSEAGWVKSTWYKHDTCTSVACCECRSVRSRLSTGGTRLSASIH